MRSLTMSNAKVIHLDDIEVTVLYSVHPHHVTFNVLEVAMGSDDRNTRWYRDIDGNETDDPDESIRVFTGYIKYDGCSEWDFMPDRATQYHICGRDGVTGLNYLLGKLFDIAEAEIPDAKFV